MFEHAYHIDLKAGEIIAIYEFNYKKRVDKYGYYKYKINDTEQKKIEQYAKSNSFSNEDFTSIYLLESDEALKQSEKAFEKKLEFINLKTNIPKILTNKDIITYIDDRESRIINIIVINLNIYKNKVCFNINNKTYTFNSIIDTNIYRLIFPDYINN